MSEFTSTNFAKLNIIQQQIADIFQKNELTRAEVFVTLKGMREFKAVDRITADEWWSELRWGDKYNGFGSHPFKPSMERSTNDGR